MDWAMRAVRMGWPGTVQAKVLPLTGSAPAPVMAGRVTVLDMLGVRPMICWQIRLIWAAAAAVGHVTTVEAGMAEALLS